MTSDNAYLFDRSLSYRERGILATMLALPPGWRYELEELVGLSITSRGDVIMGIKRLKAAGYVKTEGGHTSWACVPVLKARGAA
jgi:hypothetical protein